MVQYEVFLNISNLKPYTNNQYLGLGLIHLLDNNYGEGGGGGHLLLVDFTF